MNSPNPALVSQREAEPLPRPALFLLAAAYVLPGLLDRDPWKSADITSFGYIVNIAQGKTGWLAPTVGGLPADGSILPYWIGAAFVRLLAPMVNPIVAARIPFALLLALALALTWYAAYHLARSESAQPLPFAFGGEAAPVDYARAIADGALLALIASLGLLQLGHEGTPELVQLVGIALYLYGVAAGAAKPNQGGAFAALAIVVLAASGAPSVAMLLAAAGMATALRSPAPTRMRSIVWILVGALLGAAAATGLGAWANRLGTYDSGAQVLALARQIGWFAWPAWLLALWTLWQWRRRLASWHIVVPLAVTATLLGVWLAMAGSDRALMLALPALAVLAAFALPTLQRSAAAAIDWFSVCFVHHRGRDRMGLLRRDPDRRAGKPGQQRRQALPGIPESILVARARPRARGDGCMALAGSLAHRTPSPSALEKPGAAGRRRERLLAARHDAAPAAARQRAQLPRDDAADRAPGAGGLVRRRAGDVAGRGRRARVSGRLSRRRRRRRRRCTLRLPAVDARPEAAGSGLAVRRSRATHSQRRRRHRRLPARPGLSRGLSPR